MELKARLNGKFYFVTLLLLAIVLLGWYGLFFLNSNEIVMEDNRPMDDSTKMLFTTLITVVVLSWTVSFFVLVRQMLLGYAFVMDADGVHSTVTAVNVLAFIFVVPIKTIPYTAIKNISQDDGVLTLHLDKSKVDMVPLLRIFARGTYRLFTGFTKEKAEDVRSQLEKYYAYKRGEGNDGKQGG